MVLPDLTEVDFLDREVSLGLLPVVVTVLVRRDLDLLFLDRLDVVPLVPVSS